MYGEMKFKSMKEGCKHNLIRSKTTHLVNADGEVVWDKVTCEKCKGEGWQEVPKKKELVGDNK